MLGGCEGKAFLHRDQLAVTIYLKATLHGRDLSLTMHQPHTRGDLAILYGGDATDELDPLYIVRL